MLGALVKFSPLIVLPLWSGYPDARDNRSRLRFAGGALLAAARRVLDPVPRRRRRCTRPSSSSTTRSATSSGARLAVLDLGLGPVPREGASRTCTGSSTSSRRCSSSARSRSAAWPRRRSPLQIAAFTAALLIGFELVLDPLVYLYLPWFFPFVAIALLMPRKAEATVPVLEEDELPGALAIAGA